MARDKCQKNLTMRSVSVCCSIYLLWFLRFHLPVSVSTPPSPYPHHRHLATTSVRVFFYASRNVLCVCLF